MKNRAKVHLITSEKKYFPKHNNIPNDYPIYHQRNSNSSFRYIDSEKPELLRDFKTGNIETIAFNSNEKKIPIF